MAKYRKKPVVIEAVQFDGTLNHAHDLQQADPRLGVRSSRTQGVIVYVITPEGVMECRSGDWLMTGIKGERYPCKDDIFKETYEPVEEE